MLSNSVTLKDDNIERVFERNIIEQGTSAKADVRTKYLGRRVYIIIMRSKGEKGRNKKRGIVSHTP